MYYGPFEAFWWHNLDDRDVGHLSTLDRPWNTRGTSIMFVWLT